MVRKGGSRMKRAVVILIVLASMIGCASPPAYKPAPAGSYTTRSAQVTIGGVSSSVQAATVTQDFFDATGAYPLLGRFFIEGDHISPTTQVAVVSYELWTGRLASAPSVIGQTIEVNAHPAVIVGIAPQGFTLPESTMLWTPQ